MLKINKLEHCECLTKYEKEILTKALNSATIDAERLLNEANRGINIVGKPLDEVKKDLEILIGDYSNMKNKVEETPNC